MLKIITKGDKTIATYGPGKAVWPAVNVPDTKFTKDNGGKYSCDILIDCSEGKPEWLEKFENYLHETHEEAYQEALSAAKTKKQKAAIKKKDKHFPIEVETNDEMEETGFVKIKARCAGGFTSKRSGEFVPTPPAIFDAKRNPCRAAVGAGSTCVVGAEVRTHEFDGEVSISLSLQAVQVLALQERFERDDPNAFGFEDDDEGFVAGNAGEQLPDDLGEGAGDAEGADF